MHINLARTKRGLGTRLLNLTASQTWVSELNRKNTSGGTIYDRVLPSGFAMYANF